MGNLIPRLLAVVAVIIIFAAGYFASSFTRYIKLQKIYFVSQKELIDIERKRVGDNGVLFDGKIDSATEILFKEVRRFQNQSKILVVVDSLAMEAEDLTPEVHLKILTQLLKSK